MVCGSMAGVRSLNSILTCSSFSFLCYHEYFLIIFVYASTNGSYKYFCNVMLKDELTEVRRFYIFNEWLCCQCVLCNRGLSSHSRTGGAVTGLEEGSV